MDKIPDCPICHQQSEIFCRKDGYLIFRCLVCGLGMTKNPQEQKGSYHRDEVYIKEEAQFSNIFKRRIRIIRQFDPQPKKVLEIGSSTGLMLSLFKNLGSEVLGVDISEKTAEIAKNRGIPTMVADFEKTKLSNKSFDVVILNHTLEHLKNTKSVVKKINQLLKVRGLLLIDVPNFGSLSAKIYREDWPYLLPTEHLWHFTFKALEKILISSGLEVVGYSTASGIWDYSNPFLELWQSLTGFKKRFFSAFTTAIPTYFISQFHLGTSLTVVAKKHE